jgi:hypothetical protein
VKPARPAVIAIGMALSMHGLLALFQLGGSMPAQSRWLGLGAAKDAWAHERGRSAVDRLQSFNRRWLQLAETEALGDLSWHEVHSGLWSDIVRGLRPRVRPDPEKRGLGFPDGYVLDASVRSAILAWGRAETAFSDAVKEYYEGDSEAALKDCRVRLPRLEETLNGLRALFDGP